MIIPVRCFSCGKVLGDKWEEFEERVDNQEDVKEVLNDLGVDRYCCRTAIITNVDISEDVAQYKKI